MDLHAFETIPAQVRKHARAAYNAHLRTRDGEPDLQRKRLSHREAALERYAALGQRSEMDRVLFDAQYTVFDRHKQTPNEMMLLLALVKANATEAYGVNRVWDSVVSRASANGDEVEVMVMLEESYHTRILLSIAALYGIEIERPFMPPFVFRGLIASFAVAPRVLAMPLQLASEIMGSLSFLKLFTRAGEILKHAPLLRDTVQERIMSVLIDEIGHVNFCRMSLGRAGLSQARALLPMLAISMRDVLPELKYLDAAPSSEFALLRDLPDEVKRHAFMI